MSKIVIGFFVILVNSAFADEVFVWTDENGKKHFGDRPPVESAESGVEVKRESYELGNVDDGFPITSPNLHLDRTESYSDKKRRERLAREEKSNANKQHLAKACQDARSRLSRVRGAVTYHDENGNPVKVTEAERRKEEKQLRAAIAERCN
jgi:hypothetical protein